MIKIEKMIPGGMALGNLEDGKKAFFWNALPGEIVEEYETTKNKSHYIEAIATKTSHQNSHRITPKDECFLSTSPWQIMDFEYELELKRELIQEIFREHSIDIDKPEIITDGNNFFYRNKMEYSLYWNNDLNKIELAFHQRNSHTKIPIKKSSIERPEIFEVAKKIVEDLNSRHEEARKYQSLLLRCNKKGEVSGGLYENKKPHPKFQPLSDTILGHEYSYSPNGFFQINLPVYELALKEIKKHINTEEVLDLYAGVGTIGLTCARNHHLTLVECDSFAFNELRENVAKMIQFESIRDNGSERRSEPHDDGSERGGSRTELLSNIIPILDKSENVTNYISSNQTVILDPPRAGCHKSLIDKLNEIKPKTIIYLSCNPSTQARDIKMLLENYGIETIKTFNFFPRTPHIENLVILHKK